MDPILDLIQNDKLLEDKNEARKVWRKVARYTILDEKLYWKGFSLPLLLCIDSERVEQVLAEIHEGICGNHVRARSLA